MCGRCGCVRLAGGASRVRPALVEGVVEAALLVLLAERAGYGYELAAAIARRGLVPQTVPPPRVYEALRRLEAEGAVASDREASPVGPERRRYALTAAGRGRLDRWAEALRPAERGLRTLLAAYETQRKEVKTMCCCKSSDASHDEATTASEEQATAEREPGSLEARVAQLEAELRELQSRA